MCKLVRQDVAKLGEVLEILPLPLNLTLTLKPKPKPKPNPSPNPNPKQAAHYLQSAESTLNETWERETPAVNTPTEYKAAANTPTKAAAAAKPPKRGRAAVNTPPNPSDERLCREWGRCGTLPLALPVPLPLPLPLHLPLPLTLPLTPTLAPALTGAAPSAARFPTGTRAYTSSLWTTSGRVAAYMTLTLA